MTYKLYWCPGMGSFLPLALLAKAGAPHEVITVDIAGGEHQGPGFRAINPLAQVPTLILPDGTVMTETAAMLFHLCDAFPAAGMAPPPGTAARARLERWTVLAAIRIYEPDLRLAYPERYTTDPAGIAGIKAAAELDLHRAWALVAAEALAPGPFVLGERLSAVDIYLVMLAAWFEPAWAMPALQPAIAAVTGDPAIAPVWARSALRPV